MSTAVVKGSIQDISKGLDESLSILDAHLLVICDRSDSMRTRVASGQPRFVVEDEIVARLQARFPGQVVLMSFSDTAELCTSGMLPMPNGMTYMLPAINMANVLVGTGLKAVIITDGEPTDNKDSIFQASEPLRDKANLIFIGDSGTDGQLFAEKLAQFLGGECSVNDLGRAAPELEARLEHYLLCAGGS